MQTDVAQMPREMAERIVDPATYATPSVLHDDFAWLRHNAPIALAETATMDPFWFISRHKDIMDIERRPDIFRNGDRSTVLMRSDMLEAVDRAVGCPHLARTLVNMDGAEHRGHRMLVQNWFMPANLKKQEGRIREIARSHVDRMMAGDTECDFVADVALHYPLHVIMDILGVPEEDEHRMLMLTQQLFGAHDPELSRHAEAMMNPDTAIGMYQSVVGDFYDYFSQISASRRAQPRDDLATIIANGVVGGKAINETAANDFYILVATAGHDTTSASTAGAMWALAKQPDMLAAIKADPSLIPSLVDEAIRWVTPVKHFMRTAAQDCEIAGHRFREGDWLYLSYMSANRDEAVYSDPFEFRLGRPVANQLAFGFGPHLCIGQHIARMEMRILFEELIPRLGALELAGTGSWSQSTFVSGPKRLPIRFSRA